jgi:catechol 2,3-dioxygenase-like lactoylglutathione lyase family enzyme
MASLIKENMIMNQEIPRMINHVGLSVPDLDKAIDWYQKILGFQVLMGPYEVTVGDSYGSRMLKDFFGPDLKRLRIVHMSMGNGIGLEVFEFIEPKSRLPKNAFDYTRGGFYHICITEPNIENLVKRILDSGGRQISQIWEIYRDSGLKATYCQDPFGNVIEIFTHEYGSVWKKQPSKNVPKKS